MATKKDQPEESPATLGEGELAKSLAAAQAALVEERRQHGFTQQSLEESRDLVQQLRAAERERVEALLQTLRNKQEELDALQQQLAAEREKWEAVEHMDELVRNELKSQLAAEREKADELFKIKQRTVIENKQLRAQLANCKRMQEDGARSHGKTALMCEKTITELRLQLAAAQAAMGLADEREVELIDAAVAEATKPLVDALKKIREGEHPWCCSHPGIADAALAK